MTHPALHAQQQAAGAHFADAAEYNPVVHYGNATGEYQSVLDHAALMDASDAGRIWLRDRDQAALLQRLSTNDVEKLSPGQGQQTVLTNHNGRIIDLLTVHALPEQLLVITSPQQRGAVFNLLRKNIFFNDRVKLEQANATLGQLLLYGPESSTQVQILTGVTVTDLPLYGIVATQINGVALYIARVRPLGGAGFALYLPAEGLPSVWTALVAAGMQPLGRTAYNQLRVEAGYPAYGRELSLEYIPLETGLQEAISFTKGCYIGQEIIARMESRRRIAKHLRGLRLTGLIEAPRKLELAGKEVGDLTSVVESPRFGPIGLAYVRRDHAEPGTQLEIVESDITGEVVVLPFS
jgi:aminomethyltransferase